MEIDVCNRDTNDLSFTCCLALADLAQARQDARKAEYYISLAYAAMDHRQLSCAVLPHMAQALLPSVAA